MGLKHKIAKYLNFPLRLINEFCLYIKEWQQRTILDIDRIREEVEPIFIIGANRSGTSIISYILSQHPDVEGLYKGDVNPVYYESGHSNAFCESMHIWRYLMPNLMKGYATCWGLPGQISRTYRNRAYSDGERRRLAYDVHRYRKTGKSPLLKNNLNTLRIGLIADVFPRARFVLVCRQVEDFLNRSIRKWENDGSGTSLKWPLAGLHWHIINIVARYDLQTYAPGRYSIVWLNKLSEGEVQAKELFSEITNSISLMPFKFDFSTVESRWRKKKEPVASLETPDFSEIVEVVESERKIIETMIFSEKEIL